ncbi:MAG TPA: tetratricopeptide repeat protein [Steroidobacteraceae bacterium]|nr:tetratricopeptide repeat protein [Steroidobacteraceae bacterium]
MFRAPATPTAAGGAQTAETPSGTARPSPEIPAAPTPAPPAPAPPPHHQFQLGPAASALVAQSHTQAKGGDTAQAGATLERALRIEPDNPLLWIELGRLQLQENNAAQADAMGRKALALASGDASAQASAWRLIADSLRVRGRNQEAADAERRAASFAPH